MTPLKEVLDRLKGVKQSGQSWSARCPAHNDHKPSLSVSEGQEGRVLLKCHSGCSVEHIAQAIGLRMSDLMPERTDSRLSYVEAKPKPRTKTFRTLDAALQQLEKQLGKHSALWTYCNDRGEPVGVVVRWDRDTGKDIRPISRHADGWRIEAMPEPRPLYGLPELATTNRVIVVEGEKAADAARSIGFTATTSAGGSSAASKTDWQPLAGKEVWILPDNDAPGRKYAETVEAYLTKLGTAVKIIELPDLPEKGDIVDWIEAHGDAAEPESMRAEIESLAAEVEPQVEMATEDAFKPFPVDALPEPVRGFVVAGALSISCDQSYLAMPLLAAMAAAIGNTRRLELKHTWCVPPILWCAIIGESGTAKTPAFKLVMRPVRERQENAIKRHDAEMKAHKAELAHWQKEYDSWKRSKKQSEEPPTEPVEPACERFFVSDTTVEALAPILLANPRGLLLSRDELAGWLGSFDRYATKGKSGSDSANWLSMFNAENITVDRKTGSPRTIFVPQAAMCVCGGIQPAILKRALGDEHRESGLAARFLLAYPPRKPKQWTDADIDPDVQKKLAHVVGRLYELQPAINHDGDPQPIKVRLAPEAKDVWTKYYDAHGKEQAELTGDMAAAWSKLEEYAARLALVIHFIRWAANDSTLIDADTLDAQSMEAGIRLTGWFKNEARRVYGMLSESEPARNERLLLEWIERQGGSVTTREVQQGCRWLKAPGLAEAALEQLVNTGKGRWVPAPQGQRGQPARRFQLNAVK